MAPKFDSGAWIKKKSFLSTKKKTRKNYFQNFHNFFLKYFVFGNLTNQSEQHLEKSHYTFGKQMFSIIFMEKKENKKLEMDVDGDNLQSYTTSQATVFAFE